MLKMKRKNKNIINQKMLHEKDWKFIKKDYSDLDKREDIFKRTKILIEIIKKYKPKKILDVGCGSGYLMYQIKRNNIKINHATGLDISETAINKAKKFYDKVYVLNIDQKNFPEKKDSFDLIVCSEVLEHLYDANHCLSEIYRVLKPKGVVIITVPNFSFIIYRIQSFFGEVPNIIKDPRHLSTFNTKILKEKCKKAGLEILKTNIFKGILSRLHRKVYKCLFCDTIIIIAKKMKKENEGLA